MKKIIWILIMAVSCNLNWAQTAEYFRERTNAILIGQDEIGQKGNNNSDFADVYINWLAYKDTTGLMFGPYLIAGLSGNNSNSGYTGNSQDLGVGLNVDYYSYKPSDFDLWGELNAGLKGNWDKGQLNNVYGNYNGQQNNFLLSLGLDFNLWRKDVLAFLPRLQFQTSVTIPLSEVKHGYWNGQSIPDQVWNMRYGEVWLKASLINIYLARTFLSPKVVGFYSHSDGNQENYYGYGVELSLHKPYRDDYISFYCLYKVSDKYENSLVIGLITNLTAF